MIIIDTVKEFNTNTMTFQNPSDNQADLIEILLIEFNLNCKKEWVSKYNSYVIYDFEPLDTDGFNLKVIAESTDANLLAFMKFLLKRQEVNVLNLEGCLI